MNRKQDIADALRSQVDRLNFYITVANAEGLQVKLIHNIPSNGFVNPGHIRQIIEIEVNDLKPSNS
jgi:hypothetical protein